MRAVNRVLLVLTLGLGGGVSAWAQEPPATPEGAGPAQEAELITLELRVVALTAGGGLMVDRGTRDGVAVGDGLWLAPQGAPPREGRVVAVFEREAEVELLGAGGVPTPGTKGLVWVRRVLEAAPEGTPESLEEPTEGEPDTQPGPEPATETGDPNRPRWARPDDGWDPSQPLLARVHAERPEDRPRVIGGRVYSALGGATTVDGERGHGYLRSGFDAFVENPFERGGRLVMDAELDLRTTFVPAADGQDDGHGRVRVDELSYAWGGTRFEAESHQAGRFLLRVTPELGRLDGYEWTRRLPGGNRFGASMGYLVEDDFDASTGHDLGFSGFYRWVVDERELVSMTGAVQKTFHNGARDRERLFLKADAAPDSGLGPWSLHSALWYDLYSSEDEFEDSAGELSRAWLQAWRGYDSSVRGRQDDVSVSYRHEGYAQTLGDELPPLYAAGLVAEKSDRLGVHGGFWTSTSERFFYAAGLWKDADESGGDLEAGLALEDLSDLGLLADDGHLDLRLFASAGRSSSTLGFGAAYGRAFERESTAPGSASWELSYEFLTHDRYGFTTAVDDSNQHRLRYLADLGRLGAWRLAGNADLVVGGDDLGVVTGFFLTRSF